MKKNVREPLREWWVWMKINFKAWIIPSSRQIKACWTRLEILRSTTVPPVVTPGPWKLKRHPITCLLKNTSEVELSWESVLQLGTKDFYGDGYQFHNPTTNLWSARQLKLYHEQIHLKVVDKFSLERCESQPRKILMKEKIRLIMIEMLT